MKRPRELPLLVGEGHVPPVVSWRMTSGRRVDFDAVPPSHRRVGMGTDPYNGQEMPHLPSTRLRRLIEPPIGRVQFGTTGRTCPAPYIYLPILAIAPTAHIITFPTRNSQLVTRNP